MKSAIASFVVALAGVTAVWQSSSAGTTTYKYDALGRIATVTDGAAVIRYIYDPAGNRKEKRAQGGAATPISLGTTAVQRQGSVVLRVTLGGSSTIGTVSFYENGTLLGTAPVIDGVAVIEFMGWSLGNRTIVVSYSGDVTHPANSISVPLKVVDLSWLPAVLEILLN